MRARLFAVFRVAAVFVALEVADLPILCGDEWTDVSAPAAESVASVEVPGGGEMFASANSAGAPADCCYCPCHLTIAGTSVVDAEGLRFANDSAPDPLALLLVSRPSDIEHPPQNLL